MQHYNCEHSAKQFSSSLWQPENSRTFFRDHITSLLKAQSNKTYSPPKTSKWHQTITLLSLCTRAMSQTPQDQSNLLWYPSIRQFAFKWHISWEIDAFNIFVYSNPLQSCKSAKTSRRKTYTVYGKLQSNNFPLDISCNFDSNYSVD